jgi:hypothetical protein
MDKSLLLEANKRHLRVPITIPPRFSPTSNRDELLSGSVAIKSVASEIKELVKFKFTNIASQRNIDESELPL